MNKKITLAITIILLAASVGYIIFIGSWISSTYLPVKKYFYSGRVDEFLNHVQILSAQDSNIIANKTEITGDVRNGYAYYMRIELKNNSHDVSYGISCRSSNNNLKSGTTIELVMAYNEINKIGGYNKDAKGITPLVNIFENDFLKPLLNSQNIKVTPL